MKLLLLLSKVILIFTVLMMLSMYGVSLTYAGGKGHDKGKGQGHSSHGNGNGYGHDRCGGHDHGNDTGNDTGNDGNGVDSNGTDSGTDNGMSASAGEGHGEVRPTNDPPCSIIDWFNNGFECPNN